MYFNFDILTIVSAINRIRAVFTQFLQFFSRTPCNYEEFHFQWYFCMEYRLLTRFHYFTITIREMLLFGNEYLKAFWGKMKRLLTFRMLVGTTDIPLWPDIVISSPSSRLHITCSCQIKFTWMKILLGFTETVVIIRVKKVYSMQ